MRPYKRAVEKRVNTRLYTVEVLNYTVRTKTLHDANQVATALQDAAHRHGYTSWSGASAYPTARISSPKNETHRATPPTVYGDADLCAFVTGLSDDPMADYFAATNLGDADIEAEALGMAGFCESCGLKPGFCNCTPYTVEDHAAAWLGMRRDYSHGQH